MYLISQKFLKIISLIVFFTLSHEYLFSQEDTGTSFNKNHLVIGTKAHYGFIIAHRDNMAHLVKGHVPGFEVNLSKQTYGNESWQQLYNYPTIGLSFIHVNLGNPEQFGNGNGIFGYINFPIIIARRFMFNYRFGSGAGIVDKPFDREFNYKNNAIGSHLNILMHILLESKWKVSRNLLLTAGIGFTHFSNGAFKVPNLGINIPTVNIGASYQIGSLAQQSDFIKDSLHEKGGKIEYSVVTAFSVKEIHPPGGPKYPVYTLSGNITKPVGRKRRFGIGLYMFYDGSNIETFNSDTSNTFTEKKSEFIRTGIHFSHDLVIGKLTAITQMGVYLYTKLKNDGSLYHRFAYRYQLSKHLFICLALKTHWAKADYMEFGMGSKF
ncbi:MAG: acyloxyacyl hydrolase [Bacteroidota bacterium]